MAYRLVCAVSPAVSKGDRICMVEVVEIERMGYGTDAITHASDGKTLFVQGAVTGDVVEVKTVLDKKTYAKAKVTKLITPSPDRVSKLPVDALQSGATWANLSYDLQLRSKRANLADALRKNAKLDPVRIEKVLRDIVACKREWGYRNKVELAAFRDEAGRFCLGAHETASCDNVALSRAPLADRLIDRAPKALTGVLRYLQGDGDLGIYRVGIRGSVRTKSVEVALWTPPSAFPRSFAAKSIKDAIGATSVVRILADPGSARRVKKVEVLDGDGCWHEKMGWKPLRGRVSTIDDASSAESESGEQVAGSGEDTAAASCASTTSTLFNYRVSAPSFFQVNTAQAEVLIGLVLDGLGIESGMRVADLYSGVGSFSLPLAALGADVSAIEIAGSSTRDLVRNADAAGVDIDVICDDTAIALPKLGSLDALVVDPPRVGLEAKVIDQIAAASPERVAYVSCDPQTFARDIGRFEHAGYRLQSATPVDLFPQTYHVESVGILRKD